MVNRGEAFYKQSKLFYSSSEMLITLYSEKNQLFTASEPTDVLTLGLVKSGSKMSGIAQ